ncbi:MAG: sigma-70 family RNA polymerase sigma factor [Chlamydiia bacterium]|nr:sigma-70 family RNA polymerase sigma factor [Chlamydiia bacterium]
MRKKDRKQYAELSDNQLVLLYQQHRDTLALEYLMIKYENYIHKIASSYYWRTNLENDDILAEARVGFMEGVERYDADGYFMYFTGMWMKVKIFVAIDTYSRLIRIPVNRLKDMRKIDSILLNSPCNTYSAEEVAIITGINITKVESYLFTDNRISNLDQHYALEDDNFNDIYSVFDAEDLKHDLFNILKTLSKVEYSVITGLYGLFGENKTDKVTLGENLNISSERIRQIKDRVIRRFRHSSYSSLLLQYLN